MSASAPATVPHEAHLKVGDVAPDFTLPDQDGEPVTLSRVLEKGPVILAFYPKAFTPGCTQQNSNFRDRYGDVERKGAQVLGISTDSVETQRKFKAEYRLPYRLLSDKGGTVARLYAGTVPILGFAHRANFVIGQDRRITQIVEGSGAIDPNDAIAACPMKRPGS
jgi:thioredoxin-dependent peroxiredoxin